MATPPIALTIGNNALFIFDNSPTKSSLFNSNPISKKKIAISPSFIQWVIVCC